jgi:alpha-L-fucosidase
MNLPQPLPRIAAFESCAFGLFIHFGLYSLLGKGEWAMKNLAIPVEEYNRMIERFTVPAFDARAIAKMARSVGMKYITMGSRHHEGFSLYDTRGLSKFDSMHAPVGRDLIGEFISACREEGILPMIYHTTVDWQWDPDWQWRADATGFDGFDRYLDYLHASIEVLCTHYGKIGGLWFDGNWGYPKADWKEDRLYSLIRKHQPDALIINNTGIGAEGKTGHPEIDSVTFERSLPKPIDRRGWPKYVAGEMCHTLNQHWGVGLQDFNYVNPAEVIQSLCLSRKAGANYLLNIGPNADGSVPEMDRAILNTVGRWMQLYGHTIYEGRPVKEMHCQGKDFVLKTPDGAMFYFAFDIRIKGDDHVTLNAGLPGYRAIHGMTSRINTIRWLDNNEPLKFTQDTNSELVSVNFTGYPYGSHHIVRVANIELA